MQFSQRFRSIHINKKMFLFFFSNLFKWHIIQIYIKKRGGKTRNHIVGDVVKFDSFRGPEFDDILRIMKTASRYKKSHCSDSHRSVITRLADINTNSSTKDRIQFLQTGNNHGMYIWCWFFFPLIRTKRIIHDVDALIPSACVCLMLEKT